MDPPPGFRFRAITVEAGIERIYNAREWRDALVVVASGVLELESLDGDSYRFGRGCVLCLAGLRLRALRTRGPEPAVLFAVSRTDEFLICGGSQRTEVLGKEEPMTQHAVVTREEWLDARKELLEEEQKHAERSEALAQSRRKLPWVRVDKDYRFDTDDGEKALPELFDGRSQLLIYHLMFGPDYTGACPGCTNLADHLSGGVVHMNHRDVTLLCVSRAPLEKLEAYKRRMGWTFPWVSSYGSDFNYDFGFAFTEEQMEADEFRTLIEEPPDWLERWAEQVGTDLPTGLREGPGWNVFAREDGAVYHTYTRMAPDRDLVVPYYHQLLDQTPKGRQDEFVAYRGDEYPES
ncbi:MAG TPA: DUF899 domain-containing protein [Gaiellaceae bacterium]|nr:DUF899 domain-containing protein [Gaiellaceae bacterium]